MLIYTVNMKLVRALWKAIWQNLLKYKYILKSTSMLTCACTHTIYRYMSTKTILSQSSSFLPCIPTVYLFHFQCAPVFMEHSSGLSETDYFLLGSAEQKHRQERELELTEFLNTTEEAALCMWLSLRLWQPPPFLLPLVLWILTTLEYSFHPIFWYPICTFIISLLAFPWMILIGSCHLFPAETPWLIQFFFLNIYICIYIFVKNGEI